MGMTDEEICAEIRRLKLSWFPGWFPGGAKKLSASRKKEIETTEHLLQIAMDLVVAHELLKSDWEIYDEEIHKCRAIVKATSEDLHNDLEHIMEENASLKACFQHFAFLSDNGKLDRGDDEVITNVKNVLGIERE